MRRVTYFSLLLLSALVCGALLYGAYAVARQEAQRNLQTQQGILARQAAQGIQDYFAHSRALTYSLAQNQHVIELDGEGRQLLTNILADNTRELQAITRVDKHGIIMFSVPNNSVAGRNVSGQDHVARLLATHKPTASDVFASVQGYNAIALHVPVLRKGEFHGTLAILVDFDAIARRYLEPVRVSESGYAFVYSREGVLLYSPVPGLTGRHYTEITAGFPQLRATVEAMLRGESGEGSFAFDRVRDGTPTRVNKLAVYLPIPLEDTFWAICVATPEAVILARLMRFGLYLLPLGLAVLVFTAFGVSMGLRQFVLQREVNRRRETEAALRESEERYRSVIENISDVFYRSDAEGRLTMISPSGAALAGYASVEEILGMNSDAFWRHPKERRRMLEIIAKDGAVRDYEVELLDKSGRIIHVATSSNFYRDKDGNILGVEGIFRDISERKRMEEELRRNQARFEALYELSRQVAGTEAQMAAFTLREGLRLTGSTAGVLFFVSADGGQLNPMAWHGAPNNRRIGPFPTEADTPWAVVYATRLPLLLNDFSLFGSDIPHDHIELTRFLGVPALDGDRPVAVLGLTGKAEGYTSDDSLQISLLMDGMWRIIRSRRDEEHIRASLREKEALLREVHHRVKNNLQVVSSLLDMAGRRLSDGEARRCLEAVRAKVQAMSLVHAQLHSRGASGPTRGIDLERYVRSLFRQLREIYSGDMTLAASISLEGLVLGLDQAVPLGLALNEALTNVFKHARREDRPGQVDIRARREADGRVCIELRDDGPGLPPDLEPERTPSLGMKLMFGLVRHQLGGELTLQNAPEGVLVSLCFRPHVAD